MIAQTLAVAVPLTAAAAGLTYATVAPDCNFWGRVISRGPGGSNKIALTFDDGPTPGYTDRILDALRAASIPASFFVIGRNIEEHPDLLRRIHAEGHLIANHTYDHWHYGMLRGRGYWRKQIRRTDDLIESILNIRPALFRPPMGVKTWHITLAAREVGHSLITWTRRAYDGLPTTPDRIVARFTKIAGGDILLLHDGVEPHAPHRDRSATINAIGPLLDLIHSKGLSPVRLDDLLALLAYQSCATAT